MGIMEKEMQTTLMGYTGFRVQELVCSYPIGNPTPSRSDVSCGQKTCALGMGSCGECGYDEFCR